MKQYINIDKSSRLSSLINIVGERNIDYILAANNLTRTPNIGQSFFNKCQEAIQDASNVVNWQRKSTILNTLTESSDICYSYQIQYLFLPPQICLEME